MAQIITSKVVTGRDTRFSYVYVFEPKAMTEGGQEKYSVSLIIPKSDTKTIEAIKAAIKFTYEKDVAKLKGSGKSAPSLAQIKIPLRDGDSEKPDDTAYAGSYFINANSTQKPGVVDASLNPILDKSEVYSGCYGRASITFFVYNVNGNKGIGANLNNIQKLRDGEPLGGKSSAASDFASDDEADFLS